MSAGRRVWLPMTGGLLLLVMGLGGLILVAAYLKQDQDFKGHAAAAAGVIVEVNQEVTDANVYGDVMVQFVTESGNEVRARISWDHCCPDKGDKVKVYYDPENPADAAISEPVWRNAFELAFYGIVATGTGIFLIRLGLGRRDELW